DGTDAPGRASPSRSPAARGIHRLTIDLTETQLSRLEERGYLDPNLRGESADECDAIEAFLADALPKSR
ncbi:MAG: hypothetical protein WAK67_07875, partial [Xanthobacteraceae bacterium]